MLPYLPQVFPLLSVFFRTQVLTYLRGTAEGGLLSNAVMNAMLLLVCVLVAVFYPNVGFLIR